MRVYRTIGWLLCALLITACATMPAEKSKTQSELLTGSESAADATYKQAVSTESKRLFAQAAAAYEKLLRTSPASTTLQYKTYSSYYQLLSRGEFSKFHRAKSLYSQLPLIVQQQLAPPSYARYAYLSQHQRHNLRVREAVILEAVKEAPGFIGSHIQLARFRRSQGDLLLPIALTRQAIHLKPDSNHARLELGFAYADRVLEGQCTYDSRKSITKAIELLQAEREHSPNPFFVNVALSELYGLMNLKPLQLREARKAWEDKQMPFTRHQLAIALLDNDRFQAAREHYEALTTKKGTYPTLDLAAAFARTGQWDAAQKEADRFLTMATPASFYQALTIRLIESQSDGKPGRSYQDLTRSVNFSPWQKTLDAFWQGNLPEGDLLSEADDICKQSEAEYYIGLKQLFAGNKSQAIKRFEKVLKTRTYSFFEYRYAKQLISQLQGTR